MKASSHEKHAKQQWKKQKKQKVQTHGQGLGRGLAGDMGLNFLFFFVFCFSIVFCSLAKTSRKQKKSSDPWARSGLSTHKPKTKTKKTNKKLRNQKTKKKKKKTRLHTPRGGGQMQSVGSCLFVFVFFCFLFFCFFCLCVDSHCRCAKQRLPGTVSGCTRSKVDTLQYSNVCYDIDIVHSANEQQRGMEFNFVRLRHMLLDLCTGNAAICALPWWPVLFRYPFSHSWLQLDVYSPSHMGSCPRMGPQFVKLVQITTILFNSV